MKGVHVSPSSHPIPGFRHSCLWAVVAQSKHTQSFSVVKVRNQVHISFKYKRVLSSEFVDCKLYFELLSSCSYCISTKSLVLSRVFLFYLFLQVLGSGLNLHLTENDLVREIFELGERSPPYCAANKQTKHERVSLSRHFHNRIF